MQSDFVARLQMGEVFGSDTHDDGTECLTSFPTAYCSRASVSVVRLRSGTVYSVDFLICAVFVI